MVFTLHYYFKKETSWKWFYPYHYSPYPSDISIALEDVIKTGMKVEKGEPLTPLQQLLAVLPPERYTLIISSSCPSAYFLFFRRFPSPPFGASRVLLDPSHNFGLRLLRPFLFQE